MKTPEVGNIVVVKLTVIKVNGDHIWGKLAGSTGPWLIYPDQVSEVIPKPWVPAVGDRVVSTEDNPSVIRYIDDDVVLLKYDDEQPDVDSLYNFSARPRPVFNQWYRKE